MSPVLLDPLRFALEGSALIEASAGTGKTFTIAALYLRLVLGHGGEAAFPRALTPPEILVVTFTEAATKELRDRIRARLAEAADAFTGEAKELDPLLRDLRASYAPGQWPACAQTLRLAAEWMDEAAVSTIHGWCNRMLREHAFDSGSLFSQALEADLTELEQEAVRDYWRTFFYPLPPEDADCVAGWWKTPDALRLALRNLLPQADRLDDAPEPATALREARLARTQQIEQLRAPWPAWCDALQQMLDAAVDAKKVDGRKLKKADYQRWLQKLREWCAGTQPVPDLTATAWTRLTQAGLREAWKVADDAPRHEALEALELLRERLACLPECKDTVLAHAAHWVTARMAAEQHRRAEMGFDDLLTRLRDALRRPDSGARLAALIRRQFPVALIDEFQDTDPVQYEIFRTVYQGQADTALILIGDPKQAIYAFRGADIYTYLEARRDTAGHHTTLGTNYRSTQPMVEAVNHLFLQAEQRPDGEGAFLFRSEGENPLPFLPVQAKGREQRWRVAGADAPALTCWWHDPGEALRPGAYREALADATATEIVRLLRLAQQGQAGFVDEKRKVQRLCPRDIAVLVNDGTEARAVRKALSQRGVGSVYLSDRDNVFASDAAGELQRLLQACAAPDEGGLVRAALATALLAQDWAALDRLNHDELHWEEKLEQFRGYRNCWQRQGVLPMLRRLLHDFQVPQRLIALDEERMLTDLLHLAELLQQASMLLDGEHALVRYLAEQRAEGTVAVDNRQLRLESDADLLKVVTVHKSKGLEYPLVFVPFPCACRPVKADEVPVKWHDDEGRLQLSLRAEDAVLARADHERLGEDLRKLYVALTRARFATWIALAPTQDLERSALGYLLAGGGAIVPGQLRRVAEVALGACPSISVQPAPAPTEDRYRSDEPPLQLALPPPLPARAPEPWWIASYSRLRRAAGGPTPREHRIPQTAQEETYLEAAEERRPEAAAPVSTGTLHDFPRGPAAGSFLHGLLEWAGREGFGASAAAPAELQRQIARRCRPARWAPHCEALGTWLTRWLATPLDLRRLTPDARLVAPRELQAIQPEMEFWLAASHVEAQTLDTLVCRHTLEGLPRAPLESQQLHGMLKGFVDLVFEHEGRYYVADYKSNWLGPDDGAYTVEAMRDEVLHHRYELQYSLYLFALHRLLRSRLPDYDYERHVGGAVYVFLRGHAAPSQGLHLERPPVALMDALDRLFAQEVPA
ncbi:MAG TPA: exodeoxyribonuclease V subunit beta [Ramlibacter sp.]|uniref:exodeoxyribonuclease V subunit beta n=1 Tax=Ramlibacter sp. TaxID=1917967 RepID=UPI002D8113B5|nr:exodeoxyribonuclease V subunit beta [Ramlibacter sp.]HET8744516.1 exodeoxyribonuclease V subunit beta [Ramlibacter sp.]